MRERKVLSVIKTIKSQEQTLKNLNTKLKQNYSILKAQFPTHSTWPTLF